jgi:hypothetical protein
MTPDTIECVECDGWGWTRIGQIFGPECTHCKGEGWRERTPDENDGAAEREFEQKMEDFGCPD